MQRWDWSDPRVECIRLRGSAAGAGKANVNVARFAGTGSVNNEDGYAFNAQVIDRGEGGKNDRYSITVWRISDGEVVIDIDRKLSGGNLQIHPPNASLSK